MSRSRAHLVSHVGRSMCAPALLACLLLAACAGPAPAPTSPPAQTASATLAPVPVRPTSTPAAAYPAPFGGPATPAGSPTPAPLPTVVPPVQAVGALSLPALPHDLLALDGGVLLRWGHRTGQVERLVASGVAHFWLDPAGRQAYVVRETGPGQFGLASIDLDTGAATTLLDSRRGRFVAYAAGADGRHIALLSALDLPDAAPAYPPPSGPVLAARRYRIDLLDVPARAAVPMAEFDTAAVLAMALSPDGQWLAYIRANSTYAPSPGSLDEGAVALQPAVAGGVSSVIGTCAAGPAGGCLGLAWSPDSAALAWADGQGVWRYAPGERASLLLRSFAPGEGPRYALRAWSPRGRYLLLQQSHLDHAILSVLDTSNGTVARVPHTEEMTGAGRPPYGLATWLPGGDLVVVLGGAGYGYGGARIERWSVHTEGPLLVSEEVLSMPPPDAAFDRFHFALAPVALPDGRVAYGLQNVDNASYEWRGLYVLDFASPVPVKVNGLPPAAMDGRSIPFGAIEVIWSADGSAAIYRDAAAGTLLYVPADGSALYDLHGVFGAETCCFAWGR